MKKALWILIILFTTIISVNAQHAVVKLWPKAVPGEQQAKHPPTITNDEKNNIIRLSDITDPSFEVFPASKKQIPGPCIIICPGGGYSILALNLEGNEIAEWLNSIGITAFVLRYRVPQKQEGALQDVARAIRLIKSNASVYNIDTAKLGVMGFSAGGSLTARISIQFDNKLYAPQDLADSISCKPAFSILIYPAYLDLGQNHELTNELHVNKNSPPMFIFQTVDDPYGNSSLVMAHALRNVNAKFELHILSTGGHGYGLRKGNYASETWPVLLNEWLKLILFN